MPPLRNLIDSATQEKTTNIQAGFYSMSNCKRTGCMVRDSPSHSKWIKNFSKWLQENTNQTVNYFNAYCRKKSPKYASHWLIDTAPK
jgi:hypothetical protein